MLFRYYYFIHQILVVRIPTSCKCDT